MQCQTVLPGTECTFWGKQGCGFEGHSCQNVVEQCEGCDRVADSTIGKVCAVYPSPSKKWSAPGALCNFATHKKVDLTVVEAKINPLKASKKAAGAKKKK